MNESITSDTDSRYTLSGGRFTIAEPNNNDVNSYRCLATNEIGTVLSKVARIQFGCKLHAHLRYTITYMYFALIGYIE